jgi:formylglycine-generating enzyme required for sulfatase activity
VSAELMSQLEEIAELSPPQRVEPLIELGQKLSYASASDLAADARQRLVHSLVDVVERGHGTSRERLQIGKSLGRLGDPRLHVPSETAYWVQVESEDGPFLLGQFLVTNQEFRRFVEGGGYDDPSLWSEKGLAWLQATRERWPDLAQREDAAPFVLDNQPVVGVTWHEAEAYAKWTGARLPLFEERLAVVRGKEKRPYPWGSPFGEGNANTQEEVLNQPSAVGLYPRDRSPEGVYDLAGNVAEWCGDGVGEERWIHPGAWDQPSMAAWAKARVLQSPVDWSPALGFRLARDLSR